MPSYRFAIIDPVLSRRMDIMRVLTPAYRAEPFETVEELFSVYPEGATILAYDDGAVLDRCAAAIERRGRVVPIILYRDGAVPEQVVTAMRAGASDYLAYPFSESELARRMAESEGFVQRQTEAGQRRLTARRLLEKLSPRETEVLNCMADDKSNRAISDVLSISTRTVEAHRAALIQKLDVGSSLQAIRIALDAQTSELIA